MHTTVVDGVCGGCILYFTINIHICQIKKIIIIYHSLSPYQGLSTCPDVQHTETLLWIPETCQTLSQSAVWSMVDTHPHRTMDLLQGRYRVGVAADATL
jgi:hypothetical protein